jgi:cellulose synthase/poly-beta-1,6-N-acetylglucosamine synthase-like glycosyltransferase
MTISFFVISSLWFLLFFFTLVPWLTGMQLPMNKKLDISYLTTPLLGLYLLNTMIWLVVYLIYPFITNKVINHQLMLIKNKRFGKQQQPLVSILIPANNEENVIRRTILDCLQQTYQNIELIVVCHNCSDRTYPRAQVNDNRVKTFDLITTNAGKGIALNYGIDHANGKYICIVDCGGKLAIDFIENTLPFFDEGYAAVQGRISSNNREYNILSKLLALEQDLFSVPFMTFRSFFDKRTPLGGTGFIIRKDILIDEGKFANALIDDFELSFRLFRKKHRIAFAPLSIVYDEKPPTLGIMFRQRSRWLKGHIDLLRHRIAEPTDIIGNIYWLSPIFIVCGLLSFGIISFAIIHFIGFGYYPYTFTYVPIKIWLALTALMFILQASVLVRQTEIRTVKNIIYAALLIPFTNYWYVMIIKSFFVKSWANTKTIHGFEVLAEQPVPENIIIK